MSKKTRRSSLPREDAHRYATAAGQFFQAAELAAEFEYWNAAGVLYVHAAIAFADAMAIAKRGEKSTSENHMDALALFEEAVANAKGKSQGAEHLRKIIDQKNTVAYNGDTYRRADLEGLALHASRFRAFVEREMKAM